MADLKFSGATATTTVGDTDEYPVAVGGASRKITGANLKAAVAPKAATYITQVAESGLSAEQALGALATGILKNTTTTGVLSIAAAGTDYQGVDAELTAIAGLTSAADKGIQFTGSGTAATYDLTTAGKALLDDANAAAQLVTLGAMPALLTENLQTASYTLVLGDANLCVVINNASANNLTVPLNATVAFPTGTTIAIHQRGAGQTTVVATGGVTIDSPSGKLKLTGQYSSAALRKFGTDTWVLAGDIAA